MDYVVQKGDTVYGISKRYHLTIADLKAANPGNSIAHNRLSVGQHLQIPTYENISTIAPAVVSPKKAVMSPPATAPIPSVIQNESESKKTEAPRYLFIDRIMPQLEAPIVIPNRWKYIVVHHSGTLSGNARIFDYFHRHIRGMENGLAYHFVIGNGHDSGDGEIEVGNRWMKQLQGGHLASEQLNQIALGICFVGDFNRERPTKKQIAAAIELITYLNHRCGEAPIFKAHREINPKPTECPGKLFPVQAFHELFDHPEG